MGGARHRIIPVGVSTVERFLHGRAAMATFAVIFPAAGQSSRFRDKEKKPFTNLDGRAVWLRSVEQFVNRPDVVQCIIAVSPDDQEMFRNRFGANLVFMNIQIANGGAERSESVANA